VSRHAPVGLGPAKNAGNVDPALRALIRQIDPRRIQATIQQLTQFGTRHTASSQTDPVRGIGTATTWVSQQMQAIAATSNGNMTVQQQTFTQQPVPGRLAAATSITNVIATLQGTASPQRFYVITGHLDSRVTDLLDSTSDAPGADDDGSGVACVLELARLFATHQFPGTIVFATVSGEEEGLFGSTFMAQQMNNAGNDVQGMFSNDIIGTGDAHDGTKPDAGDHGFGLDVGDPGRQRHLGHAQHLQGQRAVRHPCRGPEREPQPGCLPARSGLTVRRARGDPG
jgi:Peptidase family M28